jgi:hypothetical protein
MKFKGIDFTEIVDVYDTHGHDREVEVLGCNPKTGTEYSAVAMESCGEIVEVFEDTITEETFSLDKYCEENPDFNDAMNGDYAGFDSFLEKNLIA